MFYTTLVITIHGIFKKSKLVSKKISCMIEVLSEELFSE